ncbi:hypothetical protein [Wolbachia endosymbiont (group B) of Eucosma cana]|uniref:hypothetical protein n=1 Tax=Wolbachia endosymbiont (group B) of Eucosma cana TaxID=2954012 RepID=UPI002227D5B5|nr:hypothetical protein [Wolbachia endosymbiont (group B) of Eucosma cana]
MRIGIRQKFIVLLMLLLKRELYQTTIVKYYNAPICLDHFFQSDPIFKMNMLINTSTHI